MIIDGDNETKYEFRMTQRASSPLSILCVMLIAALLLTALLGVFPAQSEAHSPLFSEHTHEGGVVHSHPEQPPGTVVYPPSFAASRHDRGDSLADGYSFVLCSSHASSLERPPEFS